jgi:hypothetical protein
MLGVILSPIVAAAVLTTLIVAGRMARTALARKFRRKPKRRKRR